VPQLALAMVKASAGVYDRIIEGERRGSVVMRVTILPRPASFTGVHRAQLLTIEH